VSQLCRMLFADCFAGGTYTPEELDGDVSVGEPMASAEAALPDVTAAPEGEQPSPAEPVSATAQQKKKLDVLVGQLRPEHIHTEHLYQAIARMRDTDYDEWVAGAKDVSEDGDLHWAPLRDSLSKDEASHLIDRLSSLEAANSESQEDAA